MEDKIIRTEYSDIMQKSYIDYAMSVIISRALPDVRDGLKPVQRRTLYDMYELGIRYDRPYRKSARIVGDTMGKYHPHGDSSIYGALVVLAQDFKMGIPLVDGHGNFGSIEGDGAAAMRYTEARLARIAQEMFLGDLDKDVVNFVPNFDETEKEPEVLPVRVPNLLINGSEGIAVGMATNIPTHNLGEVIDAVIALIRDSHISDEKLLTYIPGPDFPTGGIIVNKSELPEIYRTGTGKIRIRGKVEFEKGKGGKDRLVITEIPYTMLGANIGKFLNDVAALAESKKTTDITDISNQSSKEGIRIVIELKKGADAAYIEQLLYKKTRLEDTFGVNMLAVANGRPETMSLRSILEYHIDFQFELATRKYTSLLAKEKNKSEIQEGLIRAVDVIDLIIEILRGSKNQKMAKDCLISGVTDGIKFKTAKSKKMAAALHFTPAQADAILDMRLHRLIGLELEALMEEHEKTLRNIDTYTDILNNYDSMANVIISDLKACKKQFARPRKTVITDAEQAVFEEKKAEDIPAVFLMDRFGYARLVDEGTFEKNKDAAAAECRFVIPCMTNSRFCIFTEEGRMHILKASDVPLGKFRDKGTPVDNMSNFDSRTEVVAQVFLYEQVTGNELLFVTRKGMVKRVPGSEFDITRKTMAATKLSDGDTLAGIYIMDDSQWIVLQTRNGYMLRFPMEEIPVYKKGTLGVRGIRLSGTDLVEAVHFLKNASQEADVNGRKVVLGRLKIGKRDGAGSKVRN
ncbi:MAG: DNA topoisomerase 4 subunit A [Lachnospiraceae bacterium]|nr:DNA topoisomerase 4 subunit A [Lachnospiraceae bacterium]